MSHDAPGTVALSENEVRREGASSENELPSRLARATVHLCMLMLRLIPNRARPWLSRRLANHLLKCRPKRRRIVETNLGYCFPGLSREERAHLSRDYATRLARVFLDMGDVWFGSKATLARKVTLEGEAELQRALEDPRPVILLVPHTVGLEFTGLLLATRYPMIGFTSKEKSPLGAWAMTRMRSRYAECVLERSGNVRSVTRKLQEGRILYYLMDEDPCDRCRIVFVPYFGRHVATARGSGGLVALTGAQVLTCCTTLDPESGSYTAVIGRPIEGLDGNVAENCSVLRNEVERMIRAHPADYMWNLRMFQTLPDGTRNPEYRR